MYGELMRIETLVERVAELKEANRRLQTLNAELVRDLKEAQKGYRVADMGWGVECSRLYHENERLKKENEAYKDMFNRIRNLVEAVIVMDYKSENERLKKENEAYKDMFNRIRNLVEAVGE